MMAEAKGGEGERILEGVVKMEREANLEADLHREDIDG